MWFEILLDTRKRDRQRMPWANNMELIIVFCYRYMAAVAISDFEISHIWREERTHVIHWDFRPVRLGRMTLCWILVIEFPISTRLIRRKSILTTPDILVRCSAFMQRRAIQSDILEHRFGQMQRNCLTTKGQLSWDPSLWSRQLFRLIIFNEADKEITASTHVHLNTERLNGIWMNWGILKSSHCK